ncbi:complement C3-like, partial [Saccoglossus kowalevskii]
YKYFEKHRQSNVIDIRMPVDVIPDSPECRVNIVETNSRHWTTDAAIFGDGNKPYWYTHNPSAIEVETTAYALLTQVELDNIAYSNAIVVWLTSQRNSQGGFISTQDTIIALYALVKYSSAAKNVIETPVHMNCTITKGAGDAYNEVITLNDEGSMVQHIREVPVGGKLYIDTTGTGIGNLQVEVRYNTPALYAETCAFNITVNVVEPRLRRRDNTLSNTIIHLTVTVRYLHFILSL